VSGWIIERGDPNVRVWPRGEDGEEGRTKVSIKHRPGSLFSGLELQLFFEEYAGEAPLREVRVLPDDGDEAAVELRVLRRLMPQADLYLALARAAIRWDYEDLEGAVKALREVGRPGRGLPDDFYRAIAESYASLVAEGEPHPVKALGEKHHGSISAASRWLKEARRRGFVPPKEEGGDRAL
jgi:hypothetical protein